MIVWAGAAAPIQDSRKPSPGLGVDRDGRGAVQHAQMHGLGDLGHYAPHRGLGQGHQVSLSRQCSQLKEFPAQHVSPGEVVAGDQPSLLQASQRPGDLALLPACERCDIGQPKARSGQRDRLGKGLQYVQISGETPGRPGR